MLLVTLTAAPVSSEPSHVICWCFHHCHPNHLGAAGDESACMDPCGPVAWLSEDHLDLLLLQAATKEDHVHAQESRGLIHVRTTAQAVIIYV